MSESAILACLKTPVSGTLLARTRLSLAGWVLSREPIDQAVVLADGRALAPVTIAGDRPDVLRAHPAFPATARSFYADADLAAYRGRTVRLAVEFRDVTGRVHVLKPVLVSLAHSERPSLPSFAVRRLARSLLCKGAWRALLRVRADHRRLLSAGVLEPTLPAADLPPVVRMPRPSFGNVDQSLLRTRLALLPAPPCLSVMVLVERVSEARLRRTFRSLNEQVYRNWEFVVVDHGPRARPVPRVLADELGGVAAIPVHYHRGAGKIAATLGRAIAQSTAAFVAFVRGGDALAPDALVTAAETIASRPDAELVYSDEDTIDDDDCLFAPFYKPGWSPELLLAQPYVLRLAFWRRSLLLEHGVRDGFADRWDYDLALRSTDAARRIVHIPRVLYHRAGRLVRGQPEHAETGRDRAAARRAACHALERRGCDAVVSSARTPGTLRVSFRPRRSERVAIIISTRDQARLLSACVRSILRCTRYPSYEIVIVNNGSTEPESLEQLRRWSSDPRIRILNAPGPFNYSALNNLAALFTRAPLLALLNNDTEVISPRWLCEMVGVLEQDGVGAVGPKLLYGDGTIQHAGIVLGIGGVASHAHKRFPRDHGGYHGLLESVRDVSAVTGACLLTRRGLYLELGGLDEALAVAYNDTDYCLRLRARGYRVLFTPLAELYHHESASRGVDRRGAARFEAELALMRCRWGELLRRDPFYNPNLSLDRTNYQPVGDEEDRQGHSGASLRRAG